MTHSVYGLPYQKKKKKKKKKRDKVVCSTLNGMLLKLEVHFTYLGSNISSTETDVNIRIRKTLTAIDRLSTIEKSNLLDEIKLELFHVVAVSGTTIWLHHLKFKEVLDGNGTK